MFTRHLVVAGLAAFACMSSEAQSPADPSSDLASPSADTEKATFEFARLRSRVQPGEVIGHVHSGFFCGTSGDSRAVAQIEQVSNSNALSAFKLVTRDLGVVVFEKEISPFEATTSKSADYRIGATLQRLFVDMCYDGTKRKGSLELEVKWDVYSTKQQRVVMSKTTTGAFKADDFTPASFDIPAYAKSLHAVMESSDFRALAAGSPPAPVAPTWPALHLKTGATIDGDAQARADALTKSVVTVVSDVGTGTGFYIADGYLLTDRHVVGSSKYVKVKLSNGRQLVGEVLRQDATRDVALLQTESSGSPALRVALVDPPVGATMFAIGSPLGETLAGTFTRGVLSGVREFNGMRFLQSDVAINHGNSGGPMIDAQGHVVGLADLTINQAQGLAFFVPVKDALDRLAVVVDEAPAH